ncbi:MAG: DUF3467 domain-containing protein [Terriglobia bacterium]
MAKKKESKTVPPTLNVTVRLEAKAETPFYYVNYVSVGHSAYDFIIGATRIPFPLPPEQQELAVKGQPVTLEPMLQLVVPPAVAKGLMKAISDQVGKYEQLFGEIMIPTVGNEKNG